MSKRADDPVTHYLRARGCSAAVVAGGLPYLLQRWEGIGREIEKGYAESLDEYLNDMDTRQILNDVLPHVPSTARADVNASIAKVDAHVRPLLMPARGCLWGEANAKKHRWTQTKNWWYFTRPRAAGSELTGELERQEARSS